MFLLLSLKKPNYFEASKCMTEHKLHEYMHTQPGGIRNIAR